MKKAIVILCLAFGLAGCGDQGGTGTEGGTNKGPEMSTNQGGTGTGGGTNRGYGTTTNKDSTSPQ
jgi:hypothetical protein